jgi:hypothetical protein
VPVNTIPKSFLNCFLPNTEAGMQDDILCNNSEHSGKGESSSENENTIERSLDEISN